MMNELTGIGKTRAMVDRWIAAKERLKLARAEQNRAEVELLNASNELGKWLVPSDWESKEEKFNIWFGTGILQVVPTGSNNYSVSWRKEPDGKDRLEYGV